MGTRNALFARRPDERSDTVPSQREALIRTLSVSLVAVAAIAASLLLTRSREASNITGIIPGGENTPSHLKLDALREAGL